MKEDSLGLHAGFSFTVIWETSGLRSEGGKSLLLIGWCYISTWGKIFPQFKGKFLNFNTNPFSIIIILFYLTGPNLKYSIGLQE